MYTLEQVVSSLRRSPGFVLVVVVSLGLSLGIASTTFAVLDAVFHNWEPCTNAASQYQVMMQSTATTRSSLYLATS